MLAFFMQKTAKFAVGVIKTSQNEAFLH